MDSNVIYDVSAPPATTLSSRLAVPSPDGSELFFFDLSGRHLETRDALTNAIRETFGYDSVGRLVSIVDGVGNTTQIIRNSNGVPTAVVAPFGQRTELATNSAGYLSQIQPDPEQPPYLFDYVNELGLLQTKTEPNGLIHTYSFVAGKLLSDQSPDGRIVTLDGAQVGDVSTVTASETEGGVKTFSTDASQAGNLASTVTFPDGARNRSTQSIDGTTTATLADGTVVTNTSTSDPVMGSFAPVISSVLTTPAGRQRKVAVSVTITSSGSPYDWTQRVTRATVNNRTAVTTFNRTARSESTATAMGRTFVRTFDALGRTAQIVNPAREPMLLEYDSRGHLQTVTQGSRQVLYGYDSQSGFLASVTTPGLNELRVFGRDSVGRLKETLNPASESTTMAYDEVGNLASVTPPSRAPHLLGYTAADLMNSYTPPSVSQNEAAIPLSIEYTKHRLPKLVTRADGTSVQMSYRVDGKLETVTSPRGVSLTTYSNATGLVASITDVDNGALTFGYDGSLPTTTTWAGAGRPSGTVAMTYDNNLWIDVVSVNNATVVDYAYDNDGLVVGTGPMIISRSTQSGDIAAATLDNITTSLVTNTYGEVDDTTTKYSGATLYRELIRVRDVLGRVKERVETVDNVSTTYNYTYDPAGRLTDVRINGLQSTHYGFGANGNRTERSTVSGAETGTPDGQDRLIEYGTNTYTYRASGELSTKVDGSGTTTYDYDVFGNLRGVSLPDGRGIEYEIDASQRRIGKLVNGVRQYGLLYQSQLAPVAMLDSSNSVVATFVYATRSNVPDYLTKAGERYRVVVDQRGSVRLVVRSSDGVIAQRLDYDEFGRVVTDTNSGFQPFGFAGGLYDPDTGLTRFGARDYDAVTGRWTAKDPTLFGGGDTNLYTYVGNDPINFIDPAGWMKLPADPSGLGPEWVLDPTHQSPNGQRWVDPNGNTLDWHPGNPNLPKGRRTRWERVDHWHLNGGKRHEKPGTDVDIDPVCEEGGQSYPASDADEGGDPDPGQKPPILPFAPLPFPAPLPTLPIIEPIPVFVW